MKFEVADGITLSNEYLTQRCYFIASQLFLENHFIQMGVANASSENPCFTRFKSVDLSQVVHIYEETPFWTRKDMERRLEEVLHTEMPLDEISPLMRITCFWHHSRLNEFLMILNFNHVLSDGNGARLIVETLLRSIHNEKFSTGHLESSILHFDYLEGGYHCNDTIERMNPTSLSLMEKLPIIAHLNYMPASIKRHRNRFWAGTKRQEWEACNCRIRVMSVPTGDMMSFIGTCMQNKVTPHAGLYTVIIQSISDVFSNGQPLTLRSSTMVNVRRACKVPDEETGIFVTPVTRDTVVKPHALEDTKNFWDESAKYKMYLRTHYLESLKLSNMLNYISDNFPNRLLNLWSKNLEVYPMGRSSSFILNDMGQMHIEQGGEWTCKELSVAQTAIVTGGALLISFIGGESLEHFTGTMGYQKGAITEEESDKLVAAITNNIRKYAMLGTTKL
ncbi:hypothetical protein SAMD00019534_111040 [Acytostelium subglobosum LB1]|uniref:hypothetical protein n=1 Tax=Acytostelium subglobosum LB1 TaxID=1410327 RepID=UPI000644FC64|nr:hypothetical protein SAMD00019534_111040 [Acytostelium subglobosum LB1]GAM27928.1 hypothetical protein SAMD00019534_111040 [Acytostelium subglobosum LB1]|eukprot:XP_012749211.1 hypothetical protein SAMD00019534_111040 [Acytostelium subglobosum LB1]